MYLTTHADGINQELAEEKLDCKPARLSGVIGDLKHRYGYPIVTVLNATRDAGCQYKMDQSLNFATGKPKPTAGETIPQPVQPEPMTAFVLEEAKEPDEAERYRRKYARKMKVVSRAVTEQTIKMPDGSHLFILMQLTKPVKEESNDA